MGILALRRENYVTNVDQIKDKAKGVITDQVDRRTTDLGNVVGQHVNNLREMGSSLRDQGQDGTAGIVDMAADRLNRLSTYLTQTDGNRIIHDIETVARTQPVITAAAGFVVGLAGARLLKAGAMKRYRMYGSNATPSDVDGTSYGDTTSDAEIDYGIR